MRVLVVGDVSCHLVDKVSFPKFRVVVDDLVEVEVSNDADEVLLRMLFNFFLHTYTYLPRISFVISVCSATTTSSLG